MKILHLDRPNAKQELFLRAKAKHIGFGGARGGGKSWAVRTKAVLLALRYPGIKLLIVRRTYKELQNNHIDPLLQMLAGIARYNRQDKIFRFPGGSSISFGYCACDADLDQYQGAEYDVIFIDEATTLAEGWLRRITACCRGVNDFPKRIYYTCNPGGRGHAYIKRLFIDKKYMAGERAEDYTFIQSLVTDNKALMASQPDYIAQLEALPAKLRAAWLYGEWDVYEGQFFEDWQPDPPQWACDKTGMSAGELREARRYCHVIRPFAPPAGWRLYRSFDFGYAKPFSCAWWAMDYDGRLYRIMELYGCQRDRNGEDVPNEGVKWDVTEIFRRIKETEDSHPWLQGAQILGVADPACWDASRGESVAETAAKMGVYFEPGDNHRLAGWMQCHYRLAFDDNGLPMMYVFDNCKAFLRTVPQLIYSQRDPEDLDTEMEDHAADEWRYMCMARPMRPVLKKPGRVLLSDPLDQMGGQ